MNDGTGTSGISTKQPRNRIVPKLHGVTQPISVASPASDVDQLGVTECEEPFQLVRVGIALVATIPAGLLIGEEFDRHPTVVARRSQPSLWALYPPGGAPRPTPRQS